MDRTVTKNLVKIFGHLNSNVFTCKRNKDVCISIRTGKLCSKWCLRRRILTNLLLLAAISSTFDWHFGKCFWQQKLFLPSQTPYATAAITSNTHHNTLPDNNKTLMCLDKFELKMSYLTHPTTVQIVWDEARRGKKSNFLVITCQKFE